ncbi:SSD domain-containing protein [Citrus sinensis]|nr:SSD domain-containing protein [Citrus sinensis]
MALCLLQEIGLADDVFPGDFLVEVTNNILVEVILLACLVTAEKTDTLLIKDVTSSERHSKEYCAMYDICGERSDGKVLNCPYGSPSVKPDELFSAKIESLCPSISGNVCCTETQFETLRAQVQQAIPFLVGCPACLRNFLNLFCELSCSPNQSQFINVTSVSEVNGNLTVDGIDYYVTSTFGEELYNSCKDVKFGTMNTRAIDFIGAGAKSFKEWFAFIGQKAPPGFPGSPYAINFKLSIPESSGLELMNVSTYSCGDTSLGCSCGDCPLSPMCSSSEPPSPPRKEACTIRIGSLKVKCVELSLVIAYVVLISTFFGWALFQRTRERRIPPSSVEPLIKSTSDSGPDSGIMEEVNARDLLPTEGGGLSVVQGYMLSFYRTYGRWVAANPAFVLCMSLAIAFVLCLGVIRFKVETRPEKLILATLPDPKNGKQPSIITEDNFQLLFEMQKKVDGVRANDSASLVSITDICLKPLGEDCASQSVLQYFKMDPENYDSYGGIEHAEYCFQHYASSDTCLSAFKAPLDPSTVLGGFSGNNYSEASAFIITYPVNNAIDETSKENRKAVAWEKAFIQLAKQVYLEDQIALFYREELLPMVQSSNLTLSFSSESSLEEELKRESTADVVTIVVLLGLSGVILVMLSVLGSVGFFSAIGVKSTLIIMEVIPFLVLAVGVDNMCILVNAVKRQPMELVLETRISNALVEVGPSITLASLSEFLAFAVGSFIPMPACRVFSMFAALAVLLDFFLQVTAFVALIVFDCLRAEDNRIDCFPCIKIPSSGGESDEGINQRSPGLLARYMKEVHAPILGLWGVKMVVVSVFLAFTVASIGYFDNTTEYLRVGPPLYFVVKDYNYSSESRHTNQLCSISQCDSNSLLNEISRASSIPELSYIAKPAASWLDDFLVWTSPEAFGCCRKFVNGTYCPPDDQCFRHSDLVNNRPSTEQFREKLPWFLNALPSADCAKGGHGAYSTSVDLNGYESGIIQASEFRTFHTPLNKQGDYVNSLRAAREFSSRMSDTLKINIFPYSVFYIFFEQYLDIWRVALINIAVALAIILVVLVMIVIDLLGVMAILGIQLNAVSVVNLIMSIGIAVEFCVHIVHAFLVSKPWESEPTITKGSEYHGSFRLQVDLTLVFPSSSLLLPNVPGIGYYWFLAWTCVSTSDIESVRSSIEAYNHRETASR